MGTRSNETDLIPQVIKEINSGLIDCFELFLVPQNNRLVFDKKFLEIAYLIPFSVHFPHEWYDVNLSKKEDEEKNSKLLQDLVEIMADNSCIRSATIHLGSVQQDGDTEKAKNQSLSLLNKYIIDKDSIGIENTPQVGFNDKFPNGVKCLYNYGHEDIGDFSVCLDIDHMAEMSKATKETTLSILNSFNGKNIKHYHCTDTSLIKYLPIDGEVIIETPRKSTTSIEENLKDLRKWKLALDKMGYI